MTEEEYFVLYGSPTATRTIPHGGACDYCGATRSDVYVDVEGNNTCPDCDRYDDERRVEFDKEKRQFWQSKKQRGAR